MPSTRLPGGGQLHGAVEGQGTALTREFAKAVERARDAATPEGLRLGAALAATQRKWQEALRLLDEAERRGAEPGIVANDRAAIDLAAAASGSDPLGFVNALSASAEAVHEAPADATAWRNRALILERLELAYSAREAWARHLAVAAPNTPGHAEAQRSLHQLFVDYGPDSCWDQTTRWRSWLADPVANGEPRATGEDLQALRLFLEDQILPAWAEARLQGAAARADELGRAAIRIGHRMATGGGDPLALVMASQAVSSGLSGARAALTYGHSRTALRSLHYEEAAQGFAEAAEALEAAGNQGSSRARGYRATALARSQAADAAEAELRPLLGSSQASVRAYAAQQLGTLYGNRGMPAAALPLYREAAHSMASQHELASLAVVQAGLAQTLLSLGEPEAAVSATVESLRTARRSCNRYARGTVVWMNGDLLMRAGAFEAAGALQRESLAIERAGGDPAYIAASLQTIALNDVRTRHPDDALANVAAARAVARNAADASVREKQMGFLDWIEGTALVERDPATSAHLLAGALPVLERFASDSEHTAAQLTRGQALLLLGDRMGGRAELRRGVEAYEHLRENVSTVLDPARAFAEAEPAFDALTASLLAEGLDVEALMSSERGRRPARAAISPSVASDVSASAGVLYLDQMDDRLAVWWMRGGRLRRWQLLWSRAETRRRVEEIWNVVDRADPTHRLWAGELLGPAAGELAVTDRVVVVAEDALAIVPWSAMADPRGGLWVDHMAVTVAPSLVVALQPHGDAQSVALVAADAQRDVQDPLRLPPLLAAREEGTAVAAAYPQATLLLGPRASRQEVLARWQSADVLHFAVHAVEDKAMPSAARLVLSTGDGGGNLTIADIAATRFPRRPLVVLSACFTRAGRLVPLAGPMDLGREFLRSGASGVVATLRPVDDRLAAELMTAFHHEYVHDGDAPAALARAIRARRAAEAMNSEQADWAAFQYIGADPQARVALPAEVATRLDQRRRQ